MNTFFAPNTTVDSTLLESAISNFYDWNGKVPFEERDGSHGCYTIAEINGTVYIDSEKFGKINSIDHPQTCKLVLQLEEKQNDYSIY
jgi:hypothetical protein